MSSILSKLINLAGNITGTLKVTNGGTGVTSSTGTVAVVLSTSPTLVTPLLGTPTSGNLANCTAYPNVTQSVAGLVSSAGQLLGTNTNNNASSGNVGEYVQAANQAVSAGTSGQFKNCSSITLPLAGDWDVSGVMSISAGGGTFTANSGIALSLFSNNTTTDHVEGDNVIYVTPSLSTVDSSGSIPAWRVSTSGSNTIVYLKGDLTFTGGSPTMYGRISARRVR